MSLHFTREHEWIRLEGVVATVGISDHAQQALGDIVFAEVPEAGKKLAKGGEAAVVESVKAASDVYSPVGGEVVEGNEVGRVTSGGFSPSLQRPIAMGYVASHLAEAGTGLKLEQRSKLFDARVAAMPFVPHRYHRKGATQ